MRNSLRLTKNLESTNQNCIIWGIFIKIISIEPLDWIIYLEQNITDFNKLSRNSVKFKF